MIKKPKTDPIGCTQDIRAMQDALDVFSGKWRVLIIHYLMSRTEEICTFKKMEKDIEGISAKVLSKELKVLEMNKIITRTTLPTKPITVQYAITEYGMGCTPVIRALVNWGTQHRLVMVSDSFSTVS